MYTESIFIVVHLFILIRTKEEGRRRRRGMERPARCMFQPRASFSNTTIVTTRRKRNRGRGELCSYGCHGNCHYHRWNGSPMKPLYSNVLHNFFGERETVEEVFQIAAISLSPSEDTTVNWNPSNWNPLGQE